MIKYFKNRSTKFAKKEVDQDVYTQMEKTSNSPLFLLIADYEIYRFGLPLNLMFFFMSIRFYRIKGVGTERRNK
jgi:hypothetical protein